MSEVYQRKWDQALTSLSRNLVPSEEALRVANKVADGLFRVLQNNRKYDIDRARIMGSIGKKTALRIDCDFDCDVFVNDVRPKDFEDIKSVFSDVIILSNLKAERIHDTKVALQLTIEGLDFDVVPAINLKDRSDNFEQQRQRALTYMKRLEDPVKNGYKYGSSLAEWQVEFIRRQSSFAHDVIRIAKYWNKTVFLDEYISGRSSLIECIAVDAANKEESKFQGRVSILRAFRRFLESMANLHRLDIVYEMFYRRSDVDPSIAKPRPLVMDPSNPYRNFAYDLIENSGLRQKLQQYARTTIQRLDSEYGRKTASLQTVFQIQPSIAPPKLVLHNLPPPSAGSFLVGVLNQVQSKFPNMIVRNEEKFKGKGIAVKILQSYLWDNIEIVQGQQLSTAELQEKVQNIIDYNIYGKDRPSSWSSTNDKHDDYDITFEVPCGGRVIQLSLNWP